MMLFLFLAAITFWKLWLTFHHYLREAQIITSHIEHGNQPFLLFLLNPFVMGCIVFFGVIFGASYTAMRVTGAAGRIEQWLHGWLNGHDLSPLKVRRGDVYSSLILALNALYQKAKGMRGD